MIFTSKPHLYPLSGEWVCVSIDAVGAGLSPRGAYSQWEWSRLSSRMGKAILKLTEPITIKGGPAE